MPLITGEVKMTTVDYFKLWKYSDRLSWEMEAKDIDPCEEKTETDASIGTSNDVPINFLKNAKGGVLEGFKVFSDGTSLGTYIIDMSTGKRIPYVHKFSFEIQANGLAKCCLELVNVGLELEIPREVAVMYVPGEEKV